MIREMVQAWLARAHGLAAWERFQQLHLMPLRVRRQRFVGNSHQRRIQRRAVARRGR